MRLRSDEARDGVRVRRVPDAPSHDENAIRRVLSLSSFAVSASSQVGWLRDCDVVLTYLSPATVGLAPWLLERLARVPYVLYVQDLWPETITASGFIGNQRVNHRVETVLHALLRRLYRRAAGVVAISPSMAATLATRGPRVLPVSIPNWVDDLFVPPAPGASSGEDWGDRIWIMYAGGIGELQALEHAVRAISMLDDRPDIGLAFVGEGVARAGLESLTEELGVQERVRFLGPRPMADMPVLIGESAAQLVSLKDLPVFRGTIPSKVQVSMACSTPVLCAVAGDAADLVREAQAGLVVEPENPQALAAAFRAVADMSPDERHEMGGRGAAHYASELSAEAGARRLERVLIEAVEIHGP
jgi:glycosyltransferase involved in cell wall biosynthesis